MPSCTLAQVRFKRRPSLFRSYAYPYLRWLKAIARSLSRSYAYPYLFWLKAMSRGIPVSRAFTHILVYFGSKPYQEASPSSTLVLSESLSGGPPRDLSLSLTLSRFLSLSIFLARVYTHLTYVCSRPVKHVTACKHALASTTAPTDDMERARLPYVCARHQLHDLY